METRYALERGLWNQVLDLPSPAPRSKPDDSFLYARGIAAARAAWPGGREAELGLARAAADSLDRDALNRPADRDRIEAEGAAVRAAVAAAIEERGEMTVMLAHARARHSGRVTAKWPRPLSLRSGRTPIPISPSWKRRERGVELGVSRHDRRLSSD